MWASAAWGQAIDPQKAQAWLEQRFGIKSERVVEATPDTLVALRSIEPRPPSNFHVIAHVEDFKPPDALTPPSMDEEYFINCPSRRFHVERIESFSQNGDQGAQSTSSGPSLWGKAIPNSPEERIVLAVCGPAAAHGPVLAQAPVQGTQPSPAPVAAQRQPPSVRAKAPAPKPPARAIQPPPDLRLKPLAQGPARVQLFAGQDRTAALHFVEGLPPRLLVADGARRPEIVEAVSGGHPIYRVQIAGFASSEAAARFCSAARAAGQDCFVPPLAHP